jgi:hypothetical protein
VGGTEAKVKSEKERKLCTKRDLDWDPNEITLEYVLEMSIQSRQHSEQALQQMRTQFEPFIFLKFLEDIQSLYEIQKSQIDETIATYSAKLSLI